MQKKERVIFLSGKKIILRPRDKQKDLKKVVYWINNQEVIQYLAARFPQTRKEEEEWLDRKRENDITLAIETKKGLYIGNIGLHQIDYLNGTAEIGIMIGDKDYWSKGFGFDAEMTLLNYGFNTLNLRKIAHRAELRNEKSVGLAKKCGGTKEGLMKKHIFKAGQYRDMIFLAIFKSRFQKIWEEYNELEPYGGFEH